MASFDPIDRFGPDEPPPRPTTPPVRRGFLILLGGLALATLIVYGVPYVANRAGYAYEAGRARAASEALAKLDKTGIIKESSALFRMAARAVGPAVVNIRTLRGVNRPVGRGRVGADLTPVGAGSGVVIDKTHGFIVTNGHVVQGAQQILVRLAPTGATYTARLVGADPQTDLAVLQVRGALPVEAPWGDADRLDIGDWVLAIGSPFLLDQTVTHGIVSATGRNNLPIASDVGAYQDFIQTDTAVNPGNSGGPLINLKGQIIGINTAIYSPALPGGEHEARGNVGIGFAISATLARRVVTQLIEHGHVVRGYLGVTIQEIDPESARRFGLPAVHGARVVDVDPDGPADAARLKPDDVIVALDGHPVLDLSGLRNRTAGLPIGARVPLDYYRDGHRRSTEVAIAELPILRSLGLRLRDPLPDRHEASPVIDQVLPHSPAARAGIVPGTLVLAVGRTDVADRAATDRAAGRFDLNQGVPLTVQSPHGATRTLRLGGPDPEH